MSGLGVAVLGLCAAGWLALTPIAFGYRGHGQHAAVLTNRATAGGLAVASLLTLIAWILAWRRKLQADGALPPRISRRQARREARELRWRELASENNAAPSTPDPARVLSELRALLLPLLAGSPGAEGLCAERPDAEASGVVAPGAEAGAQLALAEVHHVGVPEPRHEQESLAPSGIAAIESILAGGDLLLAGCGEEEAW
jgi:hypothetical protein